MGWLQRPPTAPVSTTHPHIRRVHAVSTAGMFALHDESSQCGSAQPVKVIHPFV